MQAVDIVWLIFNMLVRYNLPKEPLLTADYQLLTRETAEKLGIPVHAELDDATGEDSSKEVARQITSVNKQAFEAVDQRMQEENDTAAEAVVAAATHVCGCCKLLQRTTGLVPLDPNHYSFFPQ